VSKSGAEGDDRNSCEYCGPGLFADHEKHECGTCVEGKFSVGGSNNCSRCDDGTFNSSPGSSSCQSCLPGTIPKNGACLACVPGKHAPFGSTICEYCGIGKYSGEKEAYCTTAEAGTSVTKTTGDLRMNTTLCLPGTYSKGATDSCASCGEASFQPSPGQVSCSTAGPGTKPNGARTGVVNCSENTFSVGGARECKQCADDSHSLPGSSACERCNTGTYYDLSSKTCLGCPSGKFTATGASNVASCEDCAPGFVSSSPGAGFCSICDAGTHSSDGHTLCIPCERGKSSGVAASSCYDCESGKYSDVEGGDSCTVCPANEVSENGATSCACAASFVRDTATCVCPSGTTGSGTLCQSCPVGTFKDSSGNAQCASCETVALGSTTILLNDTLASSPLQCVCDVNYYMYPADLQHDLQHCAKIADLDIPESVDSTRNSIDVSTLPVSPGFWRTFTNSTDIRHCFSPDACLGGANSTCAKGHTGAYCGVCLEDYSEVGNSVSDMRCQHCGDISLFTKLTGGLALLAVFTVPLAYIIWRKRRSRGRDQEDAGLAAADDLKKAQASWEAKEKKAKKIRIAAQVPSKIFLSYAQIVGGFSFNFGIRFGPVFSAVARVFSFANLDFISMTPIGCVVPVTYHSQLLVYTLVPLAMFAVLLGLYMRNKTRAVRDAFFNVFLLLSFVVLPTIATKAMNAFDCDELDTGRRVLKGDLDINCDSARHHLFQIYAGVMILVYPVGIPLMYFVLLFRARKLLDRGQAGFVNTRLVMLLEETEEVLSAKKQKKRGEAPRMVASICGYIAKQAEIDEASMQGQLIEQTEWARALPKSLITFVAKQRNVARIFWRMDGKLAVEVTLDEEGAKNEALRLRAEDEETHSTLGRAKFLYDPYEPSCWWFEVFETYRRLLLTGGQVMLKPGTPSQIVLNIVICIISMTVYGKFKPFIKSRHDTLAEIAQFQLFFTMLGALCIKVNMAEEDGYDERTFDGMLAAIQFAGPVLLAYQSFVSCGGRGEKGGGGDGGEGMFELRKAAKSIKEEGGGGGGGGSSFARQLRALSSCVALGGGSKTRKRGSEGDVGNALEMENNPMRQEPGASVEAEGKVTTTTTPGGKSRKEYLTRAVSGGFGGLAGAWGGAGGRDERLRNISAVRSRKEDVDVDAAEEEDDVVAADEEEDDVVAADEDVPLPPPPPSSLAVLPLEEWTVHVDEKSGRLYWVSLIEGATTWEKPVGWRGD